MSREWSNMMMSWTREERKQDKRRLMHKGRLTFDQLFVIKE